MRSSEIEISQRSSEIEVSQTFGSGIRKEKHASSHLSGRQGELMSSRTCPFCRFQDQALPIGEVRASKCVRHTLFG